MRVRDFLLRDFEDVLGTSDVGDAGDFSEESIFFARLFEDDVIRFVVVDLRELQV